MTDKIKLKADKFVNDKKLKLNYIKPKDLKILLAEFCEEQIAELKAECDLAIEGRDVKIKELEKENTELRNNGFTVSAMTEQQLKVALEKGEQLEKENAELKKVAEFQQSSNMSRHFENKKLKEGLTVGSTFNKALNSMNKNLEEERDKYRNMVFDKDEQLTKAKELLERLLITSCNSDVLNLLPNCSEVLRVRVEAEQFLSEVEK